MIRNLEMGRLSWIFGGEGQSNHRVLLTGRQQALKMERGPVCQRMWWALGAGEVLSMLPNEGNGFFP